MLEIFLPFATALIRHAFTTGAGALVTKGLIQSQADQLIGAGMLVFGVAWSAAQKLDTPQALNWLISRQQAKVQKLSGLIDTAKTTAGAILALGILAVLLHASPADAKDRRPALLPLIQQTSTSDLDFAKALADQVAGSSVDAAERSACYGAIKDVVHLVQTLQISANAGIVSQARAIGASSFTRFEHSKQLDDALGPSAPFRRACLPVANAKGMSVYQFMVWVLQGSK